MVPVGVLVSVDYLFAFVVFKVEDSFTQGSRRGDYDRQRLFPGAHAIDNYVIKIFISNGVQLIYQRTVNVKSVQGVTFRRERLEYSVVGFAGYFAYKRFRPFGKHRGLFNHPLAFKPDYLRLIPFSCSRYDFRSVFAVGKQHVKRDRAAQGGFAVLTGYDKYEFPVFTCSVYLMDKAESRRNQGFFPQLQDKRLFAHLAFGVPAVFLNKGYRMLSLIFVVFPFVFFVVEIPDQFSIDLVNLSAYDLPA